LKLEKNRRQSMADAGFRHPLALFCRTRFWNQGKARRRSVGRTRLHSLQVPHYLPSTQLTAVLISLNFGSDDLAQDALLFTCLVKVIQKSNNAALSAFGLPQKACMTFV
jgi:hypothetical protein